MDELVCPCGGRVFVEVRTVERDMWTGCAWCEDCLRWVEDERDWGSYGGAEDGIRQRWREEAARVGGG